MAAAPIGAGKLPISVDQTNGKTVLDVPVHVVYNWGGSLATFRAFDTNTEKKKEESGHPWLASTYSIDPSGDSVLRLEVEVQEKGFNFEVDWEGTSSVQPSPPRQACGLKSLAELGGSQQDGKPTGYQ
jgi:hypothetical protein